MTFFPDNYISPALKAIPPSGIRKFFDLAAQSKGVISLGVGEPDFVTPWHIREACTYSLEKGYTMYTSNQGLPELRTAIVRYLEENFHVTYNENKEIIITIGASEAVDLALRTIICNDDEVLIPEPSFVSYKPCTVMAGGVPVAIPTSAENEFKVTGDLLEKYITPKTKAIILSYPNNPTGAILTSKELESLCKVIKKHDLIVISDEIYGELTYEGKHTCVASLRGMRDRTILINGFSKAFAMTGWRIGYVAGHEDFIDSMLKIHQYTIMCAPVMGQNAALEALKPGSKDVINMMEEYNQRRRIVTKRFRSMGLSCFEPKGAFYIFPSIKNTGLTSEEFANQLLLDENVAVVPGNAFGESGEGFIRCSYAASTKHITEALDRIERFISRRIR